MIGLALAGGLYLGRTPPRARRGARAGSRSGRGGCPVTRRGARGTEREGRGDRGRGDGRRDAGRRRRERPGRRDDRWRPDRRRGAASTCAGRCAAISSSWRGPWRWPAGWRAASMSPPAPSIVRGRVGRGLYAADRVTVIEPGASVGGDLTLAGRSLSLGGEIGRGATILAHEAEVSGRVGRDLRFRGDRLVVRAPARLEGTVRADVVRPSAVTVDGGATVTGPVLTRVASRGRRVVRRAARVVLGGDELLRRGAPRLGGAPARARAGRGERQRGAELEAIPRVGRGDPRRGPRPDPAPGRDPRRAFRSRWSSSGSTSWVSTRRRSWSPSPLGTGAAPAARRPAARRAAGAGGRPGPRHARDGAAPRGRRDLGRRGLPRRRRARRAARPGGRSRAKLGGVRVEIRTAAEILTPERAGEWAARRAQRDDPLLRAIWREFVEAGGPVALEAASRAVPGLGARGSPGASGGARRRGPDRAGRRPRHARVPVHRRAERLRGGASRRPTRYACCAIDALGVAPMVGSPVTVRSRCHRSGAPLAFDVDPVVGPPPGASRKPRVGRAGPMGRRPALGLPLNPPQLLPVGRGARGVAPRDAGRRRGGRSSSPRRSSWVAGCSEACSISPADRRDAAGRAAPRP